MMRTGDVASSGDASKDSTELQCAICNMRHLLLVLDRAIGVPSGAHVVGGTENKESSESAEQFRDNWRWGASWRAPSKAIARSVSCLEQISSSAGCGRAALCWGECWRAPSKSTAHSVSPLEHISSSAGCREAWYSVGSWHAGSKAAATDTVSPLEHNVCLL